MVRLTGFLLLLATANAFNPPTISKVSTQLHGTTKQPPLIPEIKDISYGEESRKYRRTVYTHDDWVKHRSPNRFIRNIVTTSASGVYKNVGREVTATVSVAVLVFVWNMLVGGYTDFEGIKHDPVIVNQYLTMLQLPLTPFTLASPSLGLLLVFRTNTAYQRWDEARKNWGMNINHTRDLVRMGNAYYDKTGVSEEERKSDLQRLSLCTWAFVRAMKRHLSPEGEDEEMFQKELKERLPAAQAEAIIKAAHRPNRALYDLSMAIENLPMHFMRKNEMHKALTIFEDNLGSSERLLTSPVPLFYSRHTSRFLAFWLLFIPFALYDPFKDTWNHVGMVPATALISLFLFGIEELATQMEEPFTILPMQAFCDKIGNWCNEIVSWEDGDNGITSKESYQGHSAVYFENLNGAKKGKAVVLEAKAPKVAPPAPKVAPAAPKVEDKAPNGADEEASNGEAEAPNGVTNIVNGDVETAVPDVEEAEAPKVEAEAEAMYFLGDTTTDEAWTPQAEATAEAEAALEVAAEPEVATPVVEAEPAKEEPEAPKVEAVVPPPAPAATGSGGFVSFQEDSFAPNSATLRTPW